MVGNGTQESGRGKRERETCEKPKLQKHPHPHSQPPAAEAPEVRALLGAVRWEVKGQSMWIPSRRTMVERIAGENWKPGESFYITLLEVVAPPVG